MLEVKTDMELQTAGDLLRLAADELEATANHPDYRINMQRWHINEEGDKCSVCLAGCIMRLAHDEVVFKMMEPTDFSLQWRNFFGGLDYFRRGELRKFLTKVTRLTRDQAQEIVSELPPLDSYDEDEDLPKHLIQDLICDCRRYALELDKIPGLRLIGV